MQHPEDTTGSLERARERLYKYGAVSRSPREPLAAPKERALPHQWEEKPLQRTSSFGKRHVRLASIFFVVAFIFFLTSLGVAGYFFYYGGNAVSVNNISVDIQGPSTIAGGDTVPLALTITNKNSIAIQNATIEIDFPEGTRNADNVLNAYPRYTENLGTIPSGATVTRSVKVILFGGAGQALALPISFSYSTAGSNSVFVKKSSYAIAISSTPLSVSVGAPTEIVSGALLTFTLMVRSNASVPLNNVVLSSTFPFGFSVTSSSVPMSGLNFLLGTLAPNASKTVTLSGKLVGQDNEQSDFHFTVGTAKTAQDQTLAVTYMTQDATVAIVSPFITTTLAINGDTSANPVLNAGGLESVTVSYANTLSTEVDNTTVTVTVSGSAVDYDSIKTSNGFYRSSDHSIVFSRDTDPSLATMAPGASGIGTFTFSTLSSRSLPASPTVSFAVSASGTRAGQTNMTEAMSTSATKIAKIETTVALSADVLHRSGSISNSGPVPPVANQTTTYTIVWDVQNEGSPVAGGVVSTILPSYVSYTDVTSGAGSFAYDKGSRKVSWNVGNLGQGASAEGAFRVSLFPSTSQKNTAPALTNGASFSGYDRFAGVQVSASANTITTETKNDPGYTVADSLVQ